MKVLIISQYFSPDITAAAYRLSDTYKVLKRLGNEVYVITTEPHKGNVGQPSSGVRQENDIFRIDVSKKFSSSLLTYLYQYLYFSFKATLVALRIRSGFRFQVVYGTSPPLFVGLTTSIIKILTRAKVVLDIRDVWPESAVNLGMVRRGSLMERIGHILEKVSYHLSDELTCVAQPMRDYLKTKTSRKITVIYNGVLSENIDNKDLYASPDPNVFIYAGNIGRAQDIFGLLNSFELAIKHPAMSEAQLIIVGTGAIADDMIEEIHRLGISDRVKTLGVMPKHETNLLMQKAGTLVIPLMDSPAFQLTVPSKIFDCMSVGRPIISNVLGEGRDILKSTGANLLAAPGNVSDLAGAFINMRMNWDDFFKKAHLNRAKVLSDYSREEAVNKLDEIFKQLVYRE
jgi:glycosyltransferase involved in cell wall biosynthesis